MIASLNQLLKATSRSFYLTLRVLPRAVRAQIGLAYLLARTTDTVADTEILPVQQRLEALQKLRERILGSSGAGLNFGELARHQGAPAEKLLLEKVEDGLVALRNFSPEDQQLIRSVLDTITSGQELDLKRFAPLESAPQHAGGKNLVALQTDAELDDYTYRVAGCVGEFWTRICRAHLFPTANIDDARFIADGILFGKGLQLVNILRDLPVDLRNGRCYLPAEKLAACGLVPRDLLDPATEPKLRPLYDACLYRAESCLAAGWHYTNTVPFGQMRVRLACAWPILIGIETIERLRIGNVLDGRQRIKISRKDVRDIMVRSLLSYPFSSRWTGLFTSKAKAVAPKPDLA